MHRKFGLLKKRATEKKRPFTFWCFCSAFELNASGSLYVFEILSYPATVAIKCTLKDIQETTQVGKGLMNEEKI